MSAAPRTVVVTGGTGALGRALVDAFLEAGDRLVVPWLVEDERRTLAAERAAALEGDRLVLVEADVADDDGAAAVATAAGDAEVLVNAAGGFAGGAPVHETDLDVWDRMYRTNLRTAAAASRALVPGMRRLGRGAVVSVSAQAIAAPPAGLAAYAASKAGVRVLTEVLQRELGGDGIRVNAVAPSTIDTPANRRAMPDADFASWTPPAEIARVVLWLASDAAAAVRGAIVPV